MDTHTIHLVPGMWYELRYQNQGGNGQWYQYQMTAQVLATGNDHGRRNVTLNLRPLAGTTKLNMENVLEANPAVHAEPKLPRPIPRGRRKESSGNG